MSKNNRTKRAFSLSVCGLEDRRLCAGGINLAAQEAKNLMSPTPKPAHAYSNTPIVYNTTPTTAAKPQGTFVQVVVQPQGTGLGDGNGGIDPPPIKIQGVGIFFGD
jgi:hypothetical protein